MHGAQLQAAPLLCGQPLRLPNGRDALPARVGLWRRAVPAATQRCIDDSERPRIASNHVAGARRRSHSA